MKKVFLIHGFEGSPNGGWRPYVMTELGARDIYACSLAMPKPNEPQLSEWLDEIKRHVDECVEDEIYLVGHSLGGIAILRFLETYTVPQIRGVILVSSPCHQNKNEKIKSFLAAEVAWDVIKKQNKKVVVIHGDNDPVVPFSDAEEAARELNGTLISIPNGQHLNGAAGFTKLPEVVEQLEKMTL